MSHQTTLAVTEFFTRLRFPSVLVSIMTGYIDPLCDECLSLSDMSQFNLDFARRLLSTIRTHRVLECCSCDFHVTEHSGECVLSHTYDQPHRLNNISFLERLRVALFADGFQRQQLVIITDGCGVFRWCADPTVVRPGAFLLSATRPVEQVPKEDQARKRQKNA
jgi:hypothetical protein